MTLPWAHGRLVSNRIILLAVVASLAVSLAASARAVLLVPSSASPAATAEQLTTADWSSITDLMYAPRPGAQGGASFVNHAHDLAAVVGSGGTTVSARGETVSLELARVGRGSFMTPAPDPPTTSRDGIRATLAHSVAGGAIDEWWVNRPDGLEQGFTLAAPLPGDGPLRLELAIGGSLAPALAGENALTFAGSSLRYEGLRAWDATGASVPAHFELADATLTIVADDAQATYPLTIDPTFVSNASYLKASNTGNNDRFGESVAIDGDTLIVGAPDEDSVATGVNGDQASNSAADAGAAYVFTRNPAGWSQQAYLKASNTATGDAFGTSVGIDGDTIVVGAPLEDSNATGVNGNQSDNSMTASGAAYIFERTGTTWSQQGYLKASNTDTDDEFGHAVSLSGNTVLVGAYHEDSNGTQADNSLLNAGAAYVFTRSGPTWSQQAYVKASNVGAGDEFGHAVEIDADSLIVGAWAEDSVASGINGNQADETSPDSGAAYVLTRSGTVWTQQAYIKASTNDDGDSFGWSVGIDADTAVVGAPLEDSNAIGINGSESNNTAGTSGAAYVFARTGSTWAQQAFVKASNTGSDDRFGYGVSVSGDMFVAGAWFEDSNATGVNAIQANEFSGNSGAAYLFVRSGATWSQLAYLKASNTGGTDLFGQVVALDADTVLVGSSGEDSNATGVNGNQANESAGTSGAAYTFSTTSAFPDSTYLKASNTGDQDQFSYSVSVDGNSVVVGAWAEDSNATGVNGDQSNNSASTAGAAYVFTRSGSTWSQQAYLKASNTGGLDQFGKAVAIDGDTIVIGAIGEDSNATGVGGDQSNNSLEGAGAAYVFTRSGSTWSQQAYLKSSNTALSDQFGSSVAVDGDTVVVGAIDEDSAATGIGGDQASNAAPGAGAAYVFTRSGSTWSQQAYLKASNTGGTDEFGIALAIDRDTLAVGAHFEDSATNGVNGNQADESAGNSGAAYVFTRSGSTWSQQAYLKASNTGAGDAFGFSLAIDEDLVVVGAPEEDGNATGVDGSDNNAAGAAGAAYAFERSGSNWSQLAYLKASNTGPSDNFGYAVGVGDDVIAVGGGDSASSTGVNGEQATITAPSSGATYVFVRRTSWFQQYFIKASNTDTGDLFGDALATDGKTLVVGALGEDSNATGIGGNEADNSLSSAGAAYLFLLYGCVEPPFGDVAVSHPFCTEIRWMALNGIATGFDDDTYRPAIDVTRQAMAAFMARLAGASLTTCTTPPFTDVPTSHPFCREIQWMKDEGISTGFGDGTYRTTVDVTRQAMSAFMSRLAGVTLTTCTTAPFTDVPITHPFCQEIKWMREAGISTGFGDGTYRPGIDVTRQAMSAFMYRVEDFV